MSRKGHGKVNQPKPLISTAPKGKMSTGSACATYMGPQPTGGRTRGGGGHVQANVPMHQRRPSSKGR